MRFEVIIAEMVLIVLLWYMAQRNLVDSTNV
jgi:hypothetical protein